VTAGPSDAAGRREHDDQDMAEGSVRRTLESDRLAALNRVQALSAELDGIIADALDTNADDEHDPEGSTVAYERARLSALLAEARSGVREADRALSKLADGSYTTCEACGEKIPPERLAALPATRTCVGCAGLSPDLPHRTHQTRLGLRDTPNPG
jgi:DnaK suppressor protein